MQTNVLIVFTNALFLINKRHEKSWVGKILQRSE